jgi:hypothetical protein
MGLADVDDRIERTAEYLEDAARMLAISSKERVDLPPLVATLTPRDPEHQMCIPVVVGREDLAPVTGVEMFCRRGISRHDETKRRRVPVNRSCGDNARSRDASGCDTSHWHRAR